MVTNVTKYAQVYNPQTKRWVKINSRPGYIVGSKGTAGAYKGIPKHRRIPTWLQKMWDRAKSQRHTANPHRYPQPRRGSSPPPIPKHKKMGDRAKSVRSVTTYRQRPRPIPKHKKMGDRAKSVRSGTAYHQRPRRGRRVSAPPGVRRRKP